MSVTHPWEGPHCGTRGYASSVSTNFQGKPVSKEIASHGEEMNIQNPSLLNWCSVSIYDHFSLCFKVHVVPADNSLFCPCNSKTYCVEDWKIKPSLYHLAKWPVALCTALQKILGFFYWPYLTFQHMSEYGTSSISWVLSPHLVFSPLAFPSKPSDTCHLGLDSAGEFAGKYRQVELRQLHAPRTAQFLLSAVSFRLMLYWLLFIDNIQMYADFSGSWVTFPTTCTLRNLSHYSFWFPILSDRWYSYHTYVDIPSSGTHPNPTLDMSVCFYNFFSKFPWFNHSVEI